jgi:S-layer homology domain.
MRGNKETLTAKATLCYGKGLLHANSRGYWTMMKRHLAAIIAVVMAFALALPVMANPFADVPENHWAYEAVKQLAASGLVEGFPDGTFKGAEGMTRYQMAMVVARMLSDLDAQIRDAIQRAKDEATIQDAQQREELKKAIDEAKMQAVDMSKAAAEEIAKAAATRRRNKPLSRPRRPPPRRPRGPRQSRRHRARPNRPGRLPRRP